MVDPSRVGGGVQHLKDREGRVPPELAARCGGRRPLSADASASLR